MEEEDKVNENQCVLMLTFLAFRIGNDSESGRAYAYSWGCCSAGVASSVVSVADCHILSDWSVLKDSLNILNTTPVSVNKGLVKRGSNSHVLFCYSFLGRSRIPNLL